MAAPSLSFRSRGLQVSPCWPLLPPPVHSASQLHARQPGFYPVACSLLHDGLQQED